MTVVRSWFRRLGRMSVVSIGALGLVQCIDGSTSPAGQRSGFAFAPAWDSRAARSVALLDEAGLPLDRVRIVIIRPATDTLKDTTVTVHRGDPAMALGLTLNVTTGVSL